MAAIAKVPTAVRLLGKLPLSQLLGLLPRVVLQGVPASLTLGLNMEVSATAVIHLALAPFQLLACPLSAAVTYSATGTRRNTVVVGTDLICIRPMGPLHPLLPEVFRSQHRPGLLLYLPWLGSYPSVATQKERMPGLSLFRGLEALLTRSKAVPPPVWLTPTSVPNMALNATAEMPSLRGRFRLRITGAP